MEIYADVLFFINFIGSYAMIDVTGRITKCRAKMSRKLISAAVGGAMAVFCFCFEDFNGFFRITAAALMVILSFGYRGKKSIMQIAAFILMSFVTSGIFSAIGGIRGTESIIVKNGIMYFDMPVFTFALIFALTYITVTVSAELIIRNKSRSIYKITVILGNREAGLTALSDSGNTLREPITGRQVIIAEWEKIRTLFGSIGLSELKSNMEKYKLWVIPYHSLGNTNGIVLAFLADDIIVTEEKRRTGKIFIGIADEKLSPRGEYNALMGASV